ncbi:Subtilisin-like protein [Glarea lozoyensis ATCC 20868]|uniref:Subtilisin-like protein n=1 Tax=Glarea lozoyensis (strain ATCC 20868 / MF5171) TaxID=1116229 RepID=S3DBX8_GLAL2|nr:Subtilisin-like protein [Glarea lozoyensis ATCC 20868]EPE35932.1 Subtilisin-like protein [Glarea lozoyensis ATCC 20868]
MRPALDLLRFSTLLLSAVIASDTKYPNALESAQLESLNSYIVIFKPHVSSNNRKIYGRWIENQISKDESWNDGEQSSTQFPLESRPRAFGLKHAYDINGQLFGYSGQFNDILLKKIQQHPDIAWVERDSEVQIQARDETVVQNDAPWGLARISRRERLHGKHGNPYLYSEEAGEGVNVYIVDTGIDINHADFESRAFIGTTIIAGEVDEDEHGHGTHCSGVFIGKKFGVAKRAEICSVKAISSNGRGKQSDMIKALEWIINTNKKNFENQRTRSTKVFRGSVVDISIGGPKSIALNMAIDAAIAAGIHVSVAAGNDNGDACQHSPSSSNLAITVGASTILDERAWFSNHGRCTDIFAPGFDIPGPWIGQNNSSRSTSGTSTASPHVAGLLAYFLSLQPAQSSAYTVTPLTPQKMKKLLIAISTKAKLANVPSGTPNFLIWNGEGSSNISQLQF